MPPTISWKSCHMKSTRSSRGCSHFGFYTLLSQLARGDMLEREHGATPKPLVEDSTNIWHLSPCINPHTHAHTHTSTALQRYANLCSLCMLSTNLSPIFTHWLRSVWCLRILFLCVWNTKLIDTGLLHLERSCRNRSRERWWSCSS